MHSRAYGKGYENNLLGNYKEKENAIGGAPDVCLHFFLIFFTFLAYIEKGASCREKITKVGTHKKADNFN